MTDEVVSADGIRGFISMGKPQHYDEPRFVPKECVDHPGIELVRSEKRFEVCDCQWSCRCAIGATTYTCSVCGNHHTYTW
jgi:hypothetical protein